jgi:glyoxylase-like metal-dependent hydrolase (beta-lactamase superfamily II)
MDGRPIQDEHVVPMDDIAPGVCGLRIVFVNVFAITHADGTWTLVDAALPYSASHIRSWAERRFGTAPSRIVLTHGHFDHVSAAKELAEHWDTRIYAHRLEFPYLTGKEEYPKPDVSAGGGLMTLLSPLYPRGPVDLGNRLVELANGGSDRDSTELPELQSASALTGWRILHTPGHTPGHVSFFRSEDQTLIVGDAFCTTKPESFFHAALAQDPEFHGPPSYFTSDWNSAKKSVERLAQLDPKIVVPGHGKPLTGSNIASRLRKMAAGL